MFLKGRAVVAGRVNWFTDANINETLKTFTANAVKWLANGKESPKIAARSGDQLTGLPAHDKNVAPASLNGSDYDVYFFAGRDWWSEEDKNHVRKIIYNYVITN